MVLALSSVLSPAAAAALTELAREEGVSEVEIVNAAVLLLGAMRHHGLMGVTRYGPGQAMNDPIVQRAAEAVKHWTETPEVADALPYPAVEYHAEAIADSILAVIGAPATIAEIEARVNVRRYVPVSRESLGAVLTQLARKGRIVRVATGVYALVVKP